MIKVSEIKEVKKVVVVDKYSTISKASSKMLVMKNGDKFIKISGSFSKRGLVDKFLNVEYVKALNDNAFDITEANKGQSISLYKEDVLKVNEELAIEIFNK